MNPQNNKNNIFQNATMRNESTKMEFKEPKKRLRSIHILFLKNIRGNTGCIQTEENLSKVYKSHTGKCFISILITDMS